jgi:hypothetical protein
VKAEVSFEPLSMRTSLARQWIRVFPTVRGKGGRVKYLLLMYGAERIWQSATTEQTERTYAAHRAYGEAMQKAGVIRGGAELQPTTTATTVRFAGGRPTTVDGPFAETKEQLGGYYVIDVDNVDQAIAWAEKMPGMTEGAVEIRPLGVSAPSR